MTLLELAATASDAVATATDAVEETTVTYSGVYNSFIEQIPLDRAHWYNTLLIALIGIVVVFIVLGIIALFVKALGSVFDTLAKKKKTSAHGPSSIPAPAAPEKTVKAAEPVKAEVKLIDVTDEQAAMIMAIVSDKTGIPLNHLKFNYIKPVEDSEE